MSLSTYDCSKCGASFGIAGENTGSDEAFAAEEHYASEVERHESGECVPVAAVEIARDPRAEYIKGLRALADALESDPMLALPYNGSNPDLARLAVFARDKEQLLRWARLIPGRKEKNVTESDTFGFELLGSLHGLHLLIYGQRDQVCERVVVGTRQVTKTVPAPDAPLVEVTETVEDVEWRCSPLLADAGAVA